MDNLSKKTAMALKKLLKAKGIVYQDIAEKTGLSLPSVKRILSSGEMTLARLEEICLATEISISDVLKLVTTIGDSTPDELTEMQESNLAKHPGRFAYYDLLLNGFSPKQIEAEYKLKPSQTIKILSDLDKWGLIIWSSKYKVKLATSKVVRLRKSGPLRELFNELCVKNFLEAIFQEPSDFQEFRTLRLSENSLKKFNLKLNDLLKECGKESELETSAQIKTQNIGMYFAIRKWKLVDVFGL